MPSGPTSAYWVRSGWPRGPRGLFRGSLRGLISYVEARRCPRGGHLRGRLRRLKLTGARNIQER
eukprot:9469215-Pyramimonas_sp.AAC.1